MERDLPVNWLSCAGTRRWRRGLAGVALALGALLLGWSPAQAQAPDATRDVTGTLALAHFAPFAIDLPSTTLDISIDGAPAITDVLYGQWVTPIALPGGPRGIEVYSSLSVTPTLAFTAAINAGAETTAVLVGGASGWPLEVRYPFATAAPGTRRVQLHHFAPFAGDPAVQLDFCLQAGNGASAVAASSLAYGESAVTDLAASGAYTLSLSLPGSDCSSVSVVTPPFGLRDGQEVHALLVGAGVAPFPLQVLLRGASARVTPVHLASFSPSLPQSSVTVEISATTVITGLLFGQEGSPVELPGLGVWPLFAGAVYSPTPAFTGVLTATGYLDYLAVATGGSHQPYILRFLGDLAAEPDTASAAAMRVALTETARLRVGHFAGTSAVLSETAVDLCDAATDLVLFANLQYGEVRTASVATGFGRYYLAQTGSFCALPLGVQATTLLGAGEGVTILLGGDNMNQPLQMIAVRTNLRRVALPVVRNEQEAVLLPLPDLLLVSGLLTFHGLLYESGLVEMLRDGGPYTVFAPTNAAFAAMPPGLLNSLRADPTGALADFLRGHIVPGNLSIGMLGDGVSLTTMADTTLTFGFDASNYLRLNGAALVTPPGLRAANGWAFPISQAVLPE